MTDAPPDLHTLKQDVARKAAVAERLSRVKQSLVAEHARRKRLSERMRSEKADLDRLEGMSFAAVLAALTGSRSERTERERREYLAAKLVYDNWAAGITALQAQETELHHELARLDDAERRYAAALAARERELVSAGGEQAQRVWALSGELAEARAAFRELDEAADAAASTGKALDGVLSLLDEAEELGEWDLRSDRTYATAQKHERLGQARAAAGFAHQKLLRLRTELSDVQVTGTGLSVEMDGFTTWCDYALDDLFTDWLVQRRIRDAQERVRRTRGQVRGLTVALRARATAVQERLATLEQERRALLEAPLATGSA